MKTNTTFASKLKQYSVLSAAFAAMPAAEAQVVYTNIEPDAVLDTLDEYIGIDTDDDEAANLYIANDWSGGFKEAIILIPGGSVAGYSAVEGAYTFDFISDFNAGQIIDAGLDWIDGVGICYHTLFSANGPWENALDKFAGFRIKNGASYNYGWVRMDITQDPLVITVKDYAYNKTADAPITASIISAVGQLAAVHASAFMHDGFLMVHMPSGLEKGLVHIYDISGKNILTTDVQSGETSIDMRSYPANMYVVQMFDGGKMISSLKVIR